MQSCTLIDVRLAWRRVSIIERELQGDLTGRLIAYAPQVVSLEVVESFAKDEVTYFLALGGYKESLLLFGKEIFSCTTLYCEVCWDPDGQKSFVPTSTLSLLPDRTVPTLETRVQDFPVLQMRYDLPCLIDWL